MIALSPHGGKVALTCPDDDAQGDTLEVVWAVELDTEILDREAWKSMGRKEVDDPGYFAAFIRTLRWNSIIASDRKLF